MKRELLSAAACALLMASCSNESELMNLSETNSGLMTRAIANDEDFQIVNYDGEACVQFKNDSTYSAVLDKIVNLSNDEMISFFSRDGFVSQLQLMDEADREQEQIVDDFEKDITQPYPHQQIEVFKQKYKDVFMFEPYDSTNFIAYYKVENPLQRAFVNRCGYFFIGDSIIYAKEYSLNEYFDPEIELYGKNEATTENNSRNKAETKYQIPDGDYVKVRAEPVLLYIENFPFGEYILTGLNLLSQKKKVLWKKHHADVYVCFQFTGGFGTIGSQGFVVRNNPITIVKPVYDKLAAKLCTVGHFPYIKGTSRTMGGRIEVWSSEIPETHKGVSKVSLGYEKI